MKQSLLALLLLGHSCFGVALANVEETQDTTIGIEVNPFRFLISDDNWKSLSGTVAYFNHQNGTEIAMPFYYSRDKEDYEEIETVINVDVRYRKYFASQKTNGAYLGAFGRYTYLDGKVWDKPYYATVEKFGVGAEIGIRMKRVFDSSFYWGMSLALGGYLGKDNNIFKSSGFVLALDDNKMILDVELFKVGYEF